MQPLIRAINDHLVSEFQLSHAHLAMSIWPREKDLAGFSQYMLQKSNEERGYASRMIAYLVDCDAEVELPTSATGRLSAWGGPACAALARPHTMKKPARLPSQGRACSVDQTSDGGIASPG